jgi:IstB-like ATP binding protein
MRHHPTIEKLSVLRLNGMMKTLEEQTTTPDIEALSFEERLGLLIDRELTETDSRRLGTRLRRARLRQTTCVENIDYRAPRGLDKALMTSLASCRWVDEHLNVRITGPTGAGKSYLACAFAHKACREGYSSRTVRAAASATDTPPDPGRHACGGNRAAAQLEVTGFRMVRAVATRPIGEGGMAGVRQRCLTGVPRNGPAERGTGAWEPRPEGRRALLPELRRSVAGAQKTRVLGFNFTLPH